MSIKKYTLINLGSSAALVHQKNGNYYKVSDIAPIIEALEFISHQFCQRKGDMKCFSTSDCVTEYCLPCYAKAHIKALTPQKAK